MDSKVHPYEVDVKVRQTRRISLGSNYHVVHHSTGSRQSRASLQILLSLEIRKAQVYSLRTRIVEMITARKVTKAVALEFFETISADFTEWCTSRYRSLLLEIQSEFGTDAKLLYFSRMLSACIDAKQAAESDLLDIVSDELIWAEYAVKIKKLQPKINRQKQSNGFSPMDEVMRDSFDYFNDELEMAMHECDNDVLCEFLYHIPCMSNSVDIFQKLFPILLEKLDSGKLRVEVIPKLLLTCITTKDSNGKKIFQEVLVQIRGMNLFSAELANAIVEFAGHVPHSDGNEAVVIIGNYPELITTETIALALCVSTSSSHHQLLSMLQMHMLDVIRSEQNIETKFRILMDEDESLITILSPFIYLMLSMAAFSPLTVSSILKSIIELYDDPFEGIFYEIVPDTSHQILQCGIFSLACKLNHWNVVQALVEKNWAPYSLLQNIKDVVRLGHQKVLHIILEHLIAPDFSIKTTSGVVPRIFANTEVLCALPIIVRRFPNEVSWFLDELSNIPIPLSVPRTPDYEPEVRPALVTGLRLGFATLHEVIHPREHSALPEVMWMLLNQEGQLRKASRRRSEPNFECESCICMAPEALVTEEAIRDGIVKNGRQTNSLIRLLATGDESIILKPITQALMEFHWIYGKFWWRFLVQFFFVLASILSCSLLFFGLVEDQGIRADARDLTFISSMTIVTAGVFLVQEMRQFMDDPGDYVTSGTNVIDLSIHTTVTYIAIEGGLLGGKIPAILMALILVLHANRLLLHLRILPSVGPLVRITILASINIIPILIPMGIMLIAFAAGFFLVQNSLVPDTHWKSFGVAFQFVTTMVTFDYTMIDRVVLMENFTLRILFHTYFLIFFVNIIIALMTVNVADITSNSKAAWLIEVAELMVELEIYWPYPFKYLPLSSKLDFEEFAWFSGLLKNKMSKSHTSLFGSPKKGADELDQISVVLYTVPRDIVVETSWWTSYPQSVGGDEDDKHLHLNENDKVLDIRRATVASYNHSQNANRWTKAPNFLPSLSNISFTEPPSKISADKPTVLSAFGIRGKTVGNKVKTSNDRSYGLERLETRQKSAVNFPIGQANDISSVNLQDLIVRLTRIENLLLSSGTNGNLPKPSGIFNLLRQSISKYYCEYYI